MGLHFPIRILNLYFSTLSFIHFVCFYCLSPVFIVFFAKDGLEDALPVFKELILKNGNNGFNSWIILNKTNQKIIGSAGYLGIPDEFGYIEIGFGIIPSERRKGYCYEAVKELMKWGLTQQNVMFIKAQCEETNIVSQRVIQKLGFEKIKNINGLIEWVYKK